MVSNIFYFNPYLEKWSQLLNIFQMGWNHQLVIFTGELIQNLIEAATSFFNGGSSGAPINDRKIHGFHWYEFTQLIGVIQLHNPHL